MELSASKILYRNIISTPHERLDRKTVDFVPEAIHKECKHYGGTELNEEIKLL